jgi:hypothetical protein
MERCLGGDVRCNEDQASRHECQHRTERWMIFLSSAAVKLMSLSVSEHFPPRLSSTGIGDFNRS